MISKAIQFPKMIQMRKGGHVSLTAETITAMDAEVVTSARKRTRGSVLNDGHPFRRQPACTDPARPSLRDGDVPPRIRHVASLVARCATLHAAVEDRTI